MKKVIFCILMSVAINAWALGEQLTGTELGTGSTQSVACQSAMDQAHRNSRFQMDFLKGTGQAKTRPKVTVSGCQCNKDQAGYFQCIADWGIVF